MSADALVDAMQHMALHAGIRRALRDTDYAILPAGSMVNNIDDAIVSTANIADQTFSVTLTGYAD